MTAEAFQASQKVACRFGQAKESNGFFYKRNAKRKISSALSGTKNIWDNDRKWRARHHHLQRTSFRVTRMLYPLRANFGEAKAAVGK
ncbi:MULTISPECIES: hypothetical protein [unclassified Bradyrhizobium]|uniref:hypothetical protein n=1 Tax=unclassified Bradyrhizobium TaxID=2631580 RepID=UPI0012FBCE01|nr:MULTISPECIES: hypothetical protein [unclassified Bradyrhizobium]MCK1348564.1 hypothetical protein [Bradyrhizobium sp. CW11]MCK1349694.1 hypothetical protein [Bradyrhizobium sp. CW7]MCK1412436.1 hypothetical protein [Bradyrhizobium sp. CW4]MCK1426077.1 hypothetical protein [Bradyrhizobium sp. 87]MCK1571920.1 hypothetical protein [Bradyrhizobium sp. 174]